MSLEVELRTFKSLLPKLKDQEGQFVLIKGANLAGTFPSFEAALDQGYERFGLKGFLVKKIEVDEQPQFVHRFTSCNP